jgi:hypothetical protein
MTTAEDNRSSRDSSGPLDALKMVDDRDVTPLLEVSGHTLTSLGSTAECAEPRRSPPSRTTPWARRRA